ncbi:hypothetical protein HYU11_05150 [Candidatus Woesearchaeota archaeon]|nr:hypothetical protein [Candidatus Woesearchaeota archaeon]
MHNELEEIKKRKLSEMQRQYNDQLNQQIEEEYQAQQQIASLEDMVKKTMTKEALQRYGNIKAADPEKSIQLLVVLGRLIHMGKIRSVTDENLISILEKMAPAKKSFRIERR